MTPSSAPVSLPGISMSRVLLVARPTDPTDAIVDVLDRAEMPWKVVPSAEGLANVVTPSTRTVLVAHPELADDTLRALDAIDAPEGIVVLVVGDGGRPPLARPDFADALSRATGWQLMTLDRPVRRSLLAGLVRTIDRTPAQQAQLPEAAGTPTTNAPASSSPASSRSPKTNDRPGDASPNVSSESELDREALQRRVRELEAEVETLQGTIAKRTRRVRRMAQKLADAEHAERERIAQVLHDDLQQVLYGAQMLAQTLTERSEAAPDDEAIRDAAERIDEMLDQATSLTQTLVSETYPPVLAGADVRPILNWLALHAERTYGLDVDVEAGAVALPDQSRRTLLFQILRELLFNVVKHSGQDQATLRTRLEEGRLVAEVEDHGDGFDPEHAPTANGHSSNGGFGLMSIRERVESLGGHFDVTSTPGEGTCVTISMPNAEKSNASSYDSSWTGTPPSDASGTPASGPAASEPAASGPATGARNGNGEHYGDVETGGAPETSPDDDSMLSTQN